jgi:hypothetical protein
MSWYVLTKRVFYKINKYLTCSFRTAPLVDCDFCIYLKKPSTTDKFIIVNMTQTELLHESLYSLKPT